MKQALLQWRVSQCSTTPFGATFVAHGFSSVAAARPSPTTRSSLAPDSVPPLRSGRRSSHMASPQLQRLVPRPPPARPSPTTRSSLAHHPLVPRSRLGTTTPFGATFVAHGFSSVAAARPSPTTRSSIHHFTRGGVPVRVGLCRTVRTSAPCRRTPSSRCTALRLVSTSRDH